MLKSKFDILTTGIHEVLPKEEFKKKLDSGKPLKIKFGMDPTAPDLHLGHAVVLSKLKTFQEFGHEIILIIGDFTARIGDPTGKSKTRPSLTEEEINENAKTYFNQVGRILDLSKTKIRYNSEWFDKFTSRDFLKLCAKVTLSKIVERDDFQKRIAAKQPVGFHELLYPLIQGYDSVVLHSDVELGGTDQTFNLLMGRFLQEQYGQTPQAIITLPLLPGLDGVHKMSKSLGNYIALVEPANDAFGKLMSISDELMWTYYELLLGKTKSEINSMKDNVEAGIAHPMDLKKEMAEQIIARFWSSQEAKKAKTVFEELFQKKDFANAQEIKYGPEYSQPINIVDLIKKIGAAPTSSEARRLIEAGAVTIDGNKIKDFKTQISIKTGMQIRVGKHKFYKVI
ncbi:tyrosine--tRNA ligase [Candidatus Dependentiae bacterium]|nr:tyrosine--tRNA ligase [Candidatus Dependentiae bacterium]